MHGRTTIRFARALSLALLLAAVSCDDGTTEPTPPLPGLALGIVASGLESPVYLTSPPGDARLFVVEQPGRIRIVKGGTLLETPFLDIADRVRCCGEEGLLSVAFPPDYATTGHFFVYFVDDAGDIAVERYTAATPAADIAGTTPTPVLSIPHPTHSNHNGGLLLFGPDGMLYAGTGDGGGGGDPSGNGQDLGVLLGKLLRIDVRTLPYAIPATNPFVGDEGAREEIWAYGLRNPWRFDLAERAGDPDGADLWIADVGQNRYEEVNAAIGNPGGLNFGWNVTEGMHCYPSGDDCETTGLEAPVYEYDHDEGCSITGGFVHRGPSLPELDGHYFFSDYCGGWLASLSGSESSGFTRHDWEIPDIGNVLSFGRDAVGELYMLTTAGVVYRIGRIPGPD